MELTLLSITVWLTHFLFASAIYFNTTTTKKLPANNLSDYTENTQITGATTETNQEPRILINSTALSPQTMRSQGSTVATAMHVAFTEEATYMHQFNGSNESQNDFMDITKGPDEGSVSSASNVIMDTNTSPMDTTVSLNPARLTLKKDDNETGTRSSTHNTSCDSDKHTSFGKVLNTQTTKPVTQSLSDPSNTVTTVSQRDLTGVGDERTKADEGNYEMYSTQSTFANLNEESRGTQVTEGSYKLTSEHEVSLHSEQNYNTGTSTTEVSTSTPKTRNNWITPHNTNTPMTTSAYTTHLTVTDTTEYHTSIPVLVAKSGGYWTEQPRREHSTDFTTQQSLYRLILSTAHIERENRNETDTLDTPSGITSNNSTIIANVITDNSTNATTDKTNQTERDNTTLPNCFNTNSEHQLLQSRLVCFITIWTLAMTASVFLGISIFLCVRLSVVKERMRHRRRGQEEKGVPKWEKESLWAIPKGSVQERVEFWYINGSTLEADRKEKQRKSVERLKRKNNNDENELWIQPRVTMDDLSDFWFANRRTKEERREDRDDIERQHAGRAVNNVYV
ncbi:mucin-4-like [Xyrauchen texanus]|uniref:mucin-4-like n=1 Tax=Xyrauchen texanus TaxID=154827 RepID=UPI0022419CA5|nr:mucin-4-like [Xyrauchen texanus]